MIPVAEDPREWKLVSQESQLPKFSRSGLLIKNRIAINPSDSNILKGIKKLEQKVRSGYNRVAPIHKPSSVNKEGLFNLLQVGERGELNLLESDSKVETQKQILGKTEKPYSGLFRKKSRQSEALRRWKMLKSYCNQLRTKWQ